MKIFFAFFLFQTVLQFHSTCLTGNQNTITTIAQDNSKASDFTNNPSTLVPLTTNLPVVLPDGYSINPNNCGIRPLAPKNSVKIVGGTQAINGDWGWQIILFYSNSFTCGGSLINSLWIVTAGIFNQIID